MSNLENSIKDCISKEIEKGIIEKVIVEQLERCVKKSVEDMFGWGGEVKKVIEAKLTSVMVPYLEQYDYSEYILKLDSVLTDVLKATSLENKTILTNFKDLILEVPKEVKMSEILEKWGKHCKSSIDNDELEWDCDGAYITATLETEEVSSSWSDYKRVMVRLECEEDKNLKYEFEIYKHENENKIFTMSSKELQGISSLRNLNKFDILMLNISQGYNNIALDIENDSIDEFVEYEY